MTREQSELALQLLGLTPEDFVRVRRAKNTKEGESLLQDLKNRAKKGYHKAALELHPDRHPGDVEKAELFRLACEANDEIQKLKVRGPAYIHYVDAAEYAIRYSVRVNIKPRRDDGRK